MYMVIFDPFLVLSHLSEVKGNNGTLSNKLPRQNVPLPPHFLKHSHVSSQSISFPAPCWSSLPSLLTLQTLIEHVDGHLIRLGCSCDCHQTFVASVVLRLGDLDV